MQSAGTHFKLIWRWTSASPRTSAEWTQGDLWVYLDGALVWGKEHGSTPIGVAWTWIELAERLAETWNALRFEAGYPLQGLTKTPISPAAFEAYCEEVKEKLLPSQLEEAESTFYDFSEAHDLSRGLQGIVLPPLWFVREGQLAVLASGSKTLRIPLEEAFATLSAFAEAVLERARQSGDERSSEATRAWAERSSIDAETFASLATGMSTAELAALSPGNDLMSWLEVEREKPELNELAIAARSTHGRLTPDSAAMLLHRIRQEHGHFSDRLQKWTALALQAMQSCLDPAPFAQGIQVARSLRSAFLDARQPVDVGHVLELLDVSVDRLALDASSIDALAAWGPRRGPLFLLNTSALGSDARVRERASLAHELCHLLVDRDSSRPFGDLLSGLESGPSEQRANAFAAEFLMPGDVAGAALAKAASAAEARSAVRELAKQYEVSWQIVCRQCLNSGAMFAPGVRGFLEEKSRAG
ncbi:MAG: ImmA/IrrE family metallo-endopeptidase [Planctomycetes bacterium]|nr:ImmA/IrrE family metallo-endopeptidase [Planctomycetota bacterium]